MRDNATCDTSNHFIYLIAAITLCSTTATDAVWRVPSPDENNQHVMHVENTTHGQRPYDGRTERSPSLSANAFDGIRSGDIRAGKGLRASLDIPAHALICRVSAPLRIGSFAGERVVEGRLATGRALPYALLRRVHTTSMSVLGSRARHLRARR